MNKIRTIIRKEWEEVFKNKLVISVVIMLPLLFTAMMIGFLYMFESMGAEETIGEIPIEFLEMCEGNASQGDCILSYTMNQFMIMYLFVPLIIPINIAAYSVVGEKRNHSLEPLLATPISTWELLIGKTLAAVIPAVIATYLGFFLFCVGAIIISGGFSLILTILDIGWLAAILIMGPLMSILSVCFCLMVSSRVNDPRVAEQISSLIILPLLGLMFAQIAGTLVVTTSLVWLLSLIILILDVIAMYFCVQLFARETILTRWK